MKKIIFSIILAFLMVFSLTSISFADQDVSMEWAANSEVDLAGYYIYRSTTSGMYTFGGSGSLDCVGTIICGPNDTTCTNFTDINLSEGTYYWVCTAFDTEDLESGPSNEITYTVFPWVNTPPSAPGNLRLVVQ